MNRYILSLISVAALGGTPLLAQSPVEVQTVTHRQGVLGCDAGGCPTTTCVPECYTKEKKTILYSSGCEEFCPGCPSLGRLFGKGCENGNCGPTMTKRYLVKKVQICDEPATRCVPGQACPSGGVIGHCAATETVVPAAPIATFGAPNTQPAPLVGQKMPQATASPR